MYNDSKGLKRDDAPRNRIDQSATEVFVVIMLIVFIVGVDWLWAKEAHSYDRARCSSNEVAPT